jgi:pimeloyl-ACP methyl ester carboxylesterase
MRSADPFSDDRPSFVETADGRRLAYSEYGARGGRPVIYCHGFPSSRREGLLLHPNAIAADARIIAADRPGYGDSDHQPGRSIADWGDDVALLADRLRLERFAVLGVSGGGPYALACAERMPDRLSGCALVCPLGPIYIDDLLDQMNWAVRASLMMGRQPQWLGDLVFGIPTIATLRRWPNLAESVRSIAAPAADREVLAEGDNAAILNRTIADAMRDGAQGARADLVLYNHDWHLRFASIASPISIWHGQADGTVPIEHARWYASHLPNARLIELPDHGHYSVPLRCSPRILATLLEGRGGIGSDDIGSNITGSGD